MLKQIEALIQAQEARRKAAKKEYKKVRKQADKAWERLAMVTG